MMWPPGRAIAVLATLLCVASALTAEPRIPPLTDQQNAKHLEGIKQYKADKHRLASEFHRFPEVNKANALLGNPAGPEHCPPDFTGQFCETPICHEKTPIHEHDGNSELIQLNYVDQCDGQVYIHVDNSIKGLKISVHTELNGFPTGSLYDSQGRKVFPNHEGANKPYVSELYYDDIVAEVGTGVFVFATESLNNEDCQVAAFAKTGLVVDGGFVESAHDDHVQAFEAESFDLQRDPREHTPAYLAFQVSHLAFPFTVNTVTFYRSDLSAEYAPLAVGSRSNCNANAFVGPYVCLETGIYFAKIAGKDDTGALWQRVYRFACNAGPGPGPNPPNPPTPTPVESCENGGIIINNGTHAYCYCGRHFEGRRCEHKRCEHGGVEGKDGNCLCADAYSGPFCQHLTCNAHANRDFDNELTALNFVIRAHKNKNVLREITLAATHIIEYFEAIEFTSIDSYGLTLIVNGETKTYFETDKSEKFINAIKDFEHNWEESNECEDKILLGLDEALEIGSATYYRNSPVIVFTDALPDDAESTRFDLLQRLSQQSNPVHFIVYDSDNDQCNPSVHSPGYKALQQISQFSGGLTVRATAAGTSRGIDEAAFTLGFALYHEHLLDTNDVLDSCQYAPHENIFFVDSSIESFAVAFSGEAVVELHVVDTANETVTPYYTVDAGSFSVKYYTPPDLGHYVLRVDHKNSVLPCQYRVYGKSAYELFTGFSRQIDADIDLEQPMLNEDFHLVARINHLQFPDPENVFAEALIWTNDERHEDKREVLYASNGVYRDGCDYNIYFGQWKCTRPNQLFYVEVYASDPNGNTVKRTATGHCSVRTPEPPSADCRNGGVKVDGRCVCAPGFRGAKCEDIVCYNGGKSLSTHCECYGPYAGLHCELPHCHVRNEAVSFKPRHIGLTFVVQGSLDMRSTLIEMNSVVHQVVRDLQVAHYDWLDRFTFWKFDNQSYSMTTKSPYTETLIHELETLLKETETAKSSCQNLLVYETLIAALSEESATPHDIVYLFVSGGLKLNSDKEVYLFNLIDTLGAQVNIVLSPINKCRIEVDSEEAGAIARIAEYSGGTLYWTNRGQTLLTLPLQYENSIVFDEVRPNCAKEETFYFPIASEAQTISIVTSGDLRRDYPKFIAPGGKPIEEVAVYSSSISNLHVIYKECPDGWLPYKQHCYKFVSEPKPWLEASTICAVFGGYLLTIDNKEIDDLMMGASGGEDSWTGLNNRENGDWFWDQGPKEHIPLTDHSYTDWGFSQPDMTKHCVKLTGYGWVTEDCDKRLPYICTSHAYDVNYHPHQSGVGHLARGLWAVKLQTYSDSYTTCGVRVNVQSATQVFPRYTLNIGDDVGVGSLKYGLDSNLIIAHVESTLSTLHNDVKLEYGHFYPTENADLSGVTAFSKRDECSYEFISHATPAHHYGYFVAYTGYDAMGYAFQRIVPAVAQESRRRCTNGGVLDKANDECVCPPGFTGLNCQTPLCEHGMRAPNGVTCRCFPNFFGRHCEFAQCTRNDTNHEPPPIDGNDKTFTLVLDGSATGNNKYVLNNIESILAKTVGRLGAIEQTWFKSYAAIVVYDENHGKQASEVIVASTRNEFVSQLQDELKENYRSPKQQRDYLFALTKIIDHPDVQPGSPVYVVGDSSVEDTKSFHQNLLDAIAEKHVTINVIALDDTKPPGGAKNYKDPSIQPFIGLPYLTDGQLYQTSVKDLTDLWYYQLVSRFSGYGIVHASYDKCTDAIEYFQTGAEYTTLVVDVFTTHFDAEFDIINPDGESEDNVGHVEITGTNLIFSVDTDKPGIWTLKINHVNNPSFCITTVRALKSNAPAVGFSTDISQDGGKHSHSAQYYPEDGTNAILAYSESDLLTYAQIYTHDERQLVFASRLEKRAGCTWNYISSSIFTCPAPSFTVSVEGYDSGGHPYRRTYKTHCVGYRHDDGVKVHTNNSTINLFDSTTFLN